MLRNSEEGFTLVEMMIALVILTVAILGVAGSTSRMAVQAGNAEVKAQALQAVEDRLARVTMDPRYALLDSIYSGSESSVLDLDGFTRVTDVSTVTVSLPSGKSVSYQKVTVTVDGPYLASEVGRSVVMGAP